MGQLFDKYDRSKHEADLFAKKQASVAETHTDTRMSPEDAFRTGSQNDKVLKRLECGPATNIELARISKSQAVHSRVADVRRWLEDTKHQTVARRSVGDGVNEYEIVELR